MLKSHVCCCAGLLLVLALLLLSPALVAQQAPPQNQPDAERKPPTATAKKTKNADEAIDAALRNQVSLKFDGTPLAEVVKQLGKQHDINILLDERGLAESEIAPTTSIKFERENVTLATALEYLLRTVDCAWYVADEALHVTSREAAKNKTVTRCYPIGDLVDVPQDPVQRGAHDNLHDVLFQLASETWAEVGGAGTSQNLEDVLVVNQTWAVQEQVARLIDGLRQFRKLDVNLAADQIPAPIDVTVPTSIDLRKLLDAQVDLHFNKIPLTEVVRLLRERSKLPIRLDSKALEEGSVAETSEVSLQACNISLRSVLRHLGQLDLGFYCQHDEVVLTTIDACNERVCVRLYWVGDLVAKEFGDDYDSLVELLTTTLAPTTWQDYSGPGPIREFHPSHAILLSQTEEVHLQIEQLLKQMRQTRQENAKLLGPDKRTAEQKLVTMHYSLEKPRYTQMPSPIAADKQKDKPENKAAQQPNLMLREMAAPDYPIDPLIKWIREETDAASWQVAGAGIRLVANHLVIKQSPQVHHQIQKLLEPMGIHLRSRFDGGGGFGGPGGGGGFF